MGCPDRQDLPDVEGHTGPITSVAFSPDSERILTASDDRTVKMWNAWFGKEILTIREPGGLVTSAAFSPQYDRIVTASRDGSVRVLFSDNSDLDGPTRPLRP